MKHLRQIRKTYVRQLGRNDCGIACICMILKFSGKLNEAEALRNPVMFPDQDLSLLQLRNIAGIAGINARCVTMDLEYLFSNTRPCILHLNNGPDGSHYQVCYGATNGRHGRQYVMGDPACGIHAISEADLDAIWISRAALYFDDLPSKPAKQAVSNWHMLLSGSLIPKPLLLSIPLLYIFTAILGIAWSWALQRGINSSVAGEESHLIKGMAILLLLVTLAKNVFTYIRQQLMLRLNSTINKHLMMKLIRGVLTRQNKTGANTDQSYLKRGVQNVMKMQQAVSAFLATVLSDGSLVVLVMAALTYQSFAACCINVLYLVMIFVYTISTIPDLHFDHAHLHELSGAAEQLILQDMVNSNTSRPAGDTEQAFGFHSENHTRYLSFAEKVTSGISRNGLVQECLGTLNVVCVFVCGIYSVRKEILDYSSFMIVVILSYFVTALIPKICNSIFVVNEGIEASRDYKVTSAL